MAATASSDATDGPVLSFINKRLRALRKKQNRIIQMEESIAQGKSLNKEQEEVLRSKPTVIASIDELEKLRAPLSVAVSEEISLAIQRHQVATDQNTVPDQKEDQNDDAALPQETNSGGGATVEDLMNLLYFGSLFDVKPQNELASITLTRTHERGCCLTYDYVTDDATDLLGVRDLDLISRLGSLMVSRPVDSSLSHKNALERCIEHAKLWLANSDQPIEPSADVSYAGLREKLKKIMASDYFTTTPEMKAPVEVAAAAGNFVSFQPTGVPVEPTIQVEDGSAGHHQLKEEDPSNIKSHGEANDHSPQEEHQRDETVKEVTQAPVEAVAYQQEEVYSQTEQDHGKRDFDQNEHQYVPRQFHHNQRGGRGGGRRGYSNGRGGRGGYQNGRNHYYEQSGGTYYPRNYNNNRGRGSRGGASGGHQYNQYGSAANASGPSSS